MGREFAEIVQGLRDESWRHRRNAARALGQMNDQRAVSSLVESLSDPHEHTNVRIEAAKALGALKARSAVDALAVALSGVWDERNEDLGPWAAWALGEIGDRRAVTPLTEALKRREDDTFYFFVHREALFALADLGEVAPIWEFAEDNTRPDDLRDEARNLVARGGSM